MARGTETSKTKTTKSKEIHQHRDKESPRREPKPFKENPKPGRAGPYDDPVRRPA